MNLSIIKGNSFEKIKSIQDKSIDLCISSPPYWGLRSYQTESQVFGGEAECEHEWEQQELVNQGGKAGKNASKGSTLSEKDGHFTATSGKCIKCGAWKGEYGTEQSMEEYLENTLRWVNEVWRVLKPTGSFVLNIGDCFIGGGRGGGHENGYVGGHTGTQNAPSWADLKKNGTKDWKANSTPNSVSAGSLGGIYKVKQLLSVSSFAYCKIISETDFVLRNEMVWCKPNIPSPIRSRLKHAHEKLFWFVKDADKYYFDERPWIKKRKSESLDRDGRARFSAKDQAGYDGEHRLKGNSRSDAEQLRYMREKAKGQDKIETSEEFKYKGTAFPTGSFHKNTEETIESSWRIVPVGEGQKGFEIESGYKDAKKMLKRLQTKYAKEGNNGGNQEEREKRVRDAFELAREKTLEKYPNAILNSEHVAPYPTNLIEPYIRSLCPENGVILDPFLGSGTTMYVAMRNNRNCIGIELSEKSIRYCKARLNWNSGLGVEYSEVI